MRAAQGNGALRMEAVGLRLATRQLVRTSRERVAAADEMRFRPPLD
jgi:hypothetical protein